MKRLLLCLLLLSVSVGSWAQEKTSGVWKYTLSNGEVTITGTTLKSGTNLTIPSQIEDNAILYPVTAIGNNAFYSSSGFTGSLTIPASVKTIGDNAFYRCSGFKGSLTISEGVTSIGNNAFYGCYGLTGSLKIPASVKTIGNSAFIGCGGFKGSLIISEGVTSIGDDAFNYCSGFTGSLTIPASVKTIGDRAFYYCSGFKGSLTIPEGIEAIGNDVFRVCEGLTGTLTIPASVKTIGNYAFNRCIRLTGALKIPEGVTSIGDYAFGGCYGLTGALTIPASVKTIGDGAFNGCSGFNSLEIPEGIETIGSSTFSACPGLTGSLTIPASVKTIGYSAFNGSSGFTGTLTIPEGVTSIGDRAFFDCYGFTGLKIPEGIETIGDYTFYNCYGLTGSLTIPASVKTIGNSAFFDCYGLTGALTIPEGVKEIRDNAFSGCTRLQSVTFTSIGDIILGDRLFESCKELRYIDASNLPASLFSGFDVATKFGKEEDYTLLYLPEGATLSSNVENVVIGNACQSLKLYDSGNIGDNGYGNFGYEYGTSIIKPFTATSAVYTGKNLEDDGVYTLYLPYDIDLPASIEVYTLSSYGSKTAVFTKHTGTLAAYTPYLLKRVAGSGTQTLDNTIMPNATVVKAPEYLNNPNAGTVTDTNTGTWKFLGTTNPISNADAAANRLYVLEADNTWRPVKTANSDGYVRSLRAFLQAPEGYSGAPLAFMLEEGDTTTGLETIEAEVKKESVDIYTVDGRFVGRNYESLPSGVYIIGGKKVYKF